MKRVLIYFIFLSVFLSWNLHAGSYYYYEDFTTGFGASQSEWSNGFFYGRDGVVLGVPGCDYSSQDINAGQLQLTGSTYDSPPVDYAYEGWWVSKAVFNTNKFNSTTIQSFGVESIRKYCDIDVHTNGGEPNDTRKHSVTGFWLYVDDIPSHDSEWSAFQNFVQFGDHVGDYGVNNNTMKQKISYYSGVEVELDLKQAVRPDGRVVDISNVGNWTYNMYGNPSDPNTNHIGFRMVHDGSYIRFYMNPNPYYSNNNGLPDEYLYLGKKQVAWNQNIQFMFNHEQQCDSFWLPGQVHQQDVYWDEVLVKSAVNVSKQTNFPLKVTVSTEIKTITLKISNEILQSGSIMNSGVNYIRIVKPSQCKWPSTLPITNCITISNYYDDTAFKRGLITTSFYPNNPAATNYPATGTCAVVTNTNEIRIILGDQITNMSVSSREVIWIEMKFIISNQFTSLDFNSYVMAEQIDSMTASQKGKYSTCGWQKTEGNATVYLQEDAAFSYASISPSLIYQGPNDYSFTYYFSTTGVTGREDISWAAIEIPDGFTNAIITNFNSVIMGTSEGSLIKITNIPALTSKKVIRLDYSGNNIASPNGLDVITFSVIGSVIKGDWKWKSWVDGSSLSGSSLLTGTNVNYPSQVVKVSGETPKVDGEITLPSSGDPRVLFNTITVNTLEYKLRNTSDNLDNKIYDAVIIVPGIFTNIQKVSSSRISTNYIKIGTIGNVTYITLHYGLGGNPIPYNYGEDRFKFQTIHNIAYPDSTNVTFSAVINNSNGEWYMPVTTSGLVNDILVTSPIPVGSCSITPLDGIVYTSDVTNSFTYQIKNTAPDGNIDFANIVFPGTYFTNITSVTSSLISGAFITIGSTNIFLDYNGAGTNIGINQKDDIIITLSDKYTNIAVPDNVTITSKVSNLGGKINNTSDLNPPDETRDVYFIPQGAKVQSYVSNNWVLTEVTVSTLYYIFHNNGAPGNKINYAEATFSAGGLSITKATSINSGLWSIAGLTFSKSSYNLDGGESDVVMLVISDSITGDDSRQLIPNVTVNTSIMVQTELPSGKTNTVFFQTPPPQAKVKISPIFMFTSTNKITNTFTYTFYNDGDGSNELEQAVIYIPGILNDKVTGTYSSWLGGAAYITNKADRIIISYIDAGNTLNAKTNDQITFIVTNNISSNQSLYWKSGVANNDGKGIYTNTGILPDGTKTVSVIGQAQAYISSSTNIYNSTTTNDFNYKFFNPATGEEIINVRIYIPTSVYTIVTNTITSVNKGGSASIKVTNNYIEVGYSANTLKPTENDIINFKIVDNIIKDTNTSKWESKMQYQTNDVFYRTSEDTGTQFLYIIHTPASAVITVVPDNLYTTAFTNSLTVIITNQGSGDNYLTRIRLDYPQTNWNILTADSAIITNSANEYASGGYLYFKYDLESTNIPAGASDTITIVFSDNITNITTRTLYSGVNNLDPGVDDYSTGAGDELIEFVSPADAYITPSSYDVTTYTNTYTYKINNVGKPRAIHRAVIILPGIINNIITNYSSWIADDSTNIRVSGISSITLDYASDVNGSLSTIGNDTITIVASDSRDFGETNVVFNCFVDDGYGYVETETTIGQTKIVNYYIPVASAEAYISPQTITTVSESNTFTYITQNTGTGSNNIMHSRITIPAGFSKVTNIQSTIISDDANNAKVTGSYIELDYASDGSRITPLTFETVTFMAFDSISNENNYLWRSEVDNITPATNYMFTSVYGGESQTVQSVIPGFAGRGYITPNQVYSTVITNHVFSMIIENVGQSGNNIDKADIYIPTVAFKTNGIDISSSTISNTHISLISNNVIRLDYQGEGKSITPLSSDTVTIKIFDTMTNGSQTVNWDLKVKFNTTTDYETTTVPPSQSKDVSLVMPQAMASAYIEPTIVYTIETNKTFIYKIINDGDGDNNIIEAKIIVPTPLFTVQGGFVQSSHITNDAAWAQHAGGIITLRYAQDAGGPLLTSQTDTITISATVSASSPTNNIIWQSSVTNEGCSAYPSTTTTSGKEKDVDILELTAKASADIEPNFIYSTDITNIFTYPVKNLGASSDKIYKLKILIPSAVTNVYNITSSIIGTSGITTNWSSNFILVDYDSQGTNILSLAQDTITFGAEDNIDSGEATNFWDAKVNFLNSFGYINTETGGGLSKDVVLTMPPIMAEGELITTSIAISESNTNRTIQYEIRNNGTGNNKIYYARIKLPTLFSNSGVKATSGLIGGTFVVISNSGPTNIIKIKYEDTVNKLPAQTVDIITITFTNYLIPNEHFGLGFICEVRNSVAPPLTQIDKGTKLNIVNPSPYQADAYLMDDSQFIYTLDKSADLTYRIDNKSGVHGIKKAVVSFDSTIFSNIQITSRLLGAGSISTTLTNIVLNYTNGEFTKVGTGQNYYDVLHIKFDFNISIPTSRTLACGITFEDDYPIDAPEGSETQVLQVEYAYWGKIEGIIKPNENVNLNIYKAEKSANATNYLGQKAFLSTVQSTTDVAAFTIDRLPPGEYDIECQKTGYRTYRYAVNVSVNANNITYADLIILKNNKIEANSTSGRCVYCFDDDENSYICFPAGSVLEDFYLDIYKKSISTEQINAISKNASILKPFFAPDIKVFDFELQDINENEIDEMELDKSVTIVLHYTGEELKTQGWNEDSQAIFYWKHSTGKWIRLGGEIDKAKNTVTIKVAYLHTSYTIFGATAVNYTKIFGDLKAWPQAFSPGRGGDTFAKFKVTFIFKSPVNEFKFKIYDLTGREIYCKQYDTGPYYQGDIPWNGQDNDGVVAKSGVYIYQIEVGDEYYRGKVMLLK